MQITPKTMFSMLIPVLCLGFAQIGTAGPLRVGAARVDITWQAYPEGRVPRLEFAHEYLYARAIVLDNGESKAVLLGIDQNALRNVWEMAAPQIAAELDIPVSHILMSATHASSGVPVPFQEAHPEETVKAFVEATRLANANLQPASVGFGEGAVYLNANRDYYNANINEWTQAPNLDYPSDKTLGVLAFFNEQGAPIAGYMNYAMHGNSGFRVGFYTGDFPAASSRYVEQAFGDDMVMIFTQGASGDQNPLYMRQSTNVLAAVSGVEITGFDMRRAPIEEPVREGWIERGEQNPAVDRELKVWMQAMGMVVGEEAIRVMSRMDHLAQDVSFSSQQKMLTCPGRDRTDIGTPREGVAGVYADGQDVNIRIGFLGINDIALTSVNAEVYNLIGQQVKAASPLRRTMMVTLANGRANSGYIATDDAYSRYTFQVVNSRLKPGCAQQAIVNNLTDIIYEYVQ